MKIRHCVITAALGSVLLLAGCSGKSDPASDGTDSVQPTGTDSAQISEQDIQAAVGMVRQSGIERIKSSGDTISDEEMARYVQNTAVCDLDFDGADELLVVDSFSVPEVHVFEKENGGMEESTAFLMKPLMYSDNKLELKPYENKDEKYYFFTFRESEGVMKADVLGAVKPSESGYTAEYLYSWGTLEYEDLAEPVKKEFYRKGWDKYDIGLTDSNPNDIPKETLAGILEGYNISIE